MMKSLSLVHPKISPKNVNCSVDFKIIDDHLQANFDVKNPAIYSKAFYKDDEFPYQFDVVEVFLCAHHEQSHNYPYYEYEVTPLNQTFQVIVDFQNNHQVFKRGVDLGQKTQAISTDHGWNAQILIPLTPLGWRGNPLNIRGNALAILGPPNQRSYWALSLEPQLTPNFHHPEFFVPLIN